MPTQKKTLQYLCIFGKWTDETASRIIPAYNAETYKRVKTFSLIRSDDDKVLKMFSFDRTTRNILLPYLAESPEHRVMFEEIEKSADKYFNEFFEKQLQIGKNKNRRKPFYGNEKAHTYFEIWAEIISETSFEPEEFMSRYEENLSKFVNLFDISTRESVAEKFFVKVKKFNEPQSAPYAYFEHCFGAVNFARQNYSDALILAESAYDKFKQLELAENELKYKIAVMKGLADIYDKLKYYKKEIDLREEILKISRRIFKPTDNENIIDAMKNFADALYNGDRKKDATEIYREIFERLEKYGDERTAEAEELYASCLRGVGKLDDAILHYENVLNLYKNLGDDKEAIRILEVLSHRFCDAKYFEKKLSWKQELLKLYRKTCEDRFDFDIMHTINEIADTLEKLGRKADAHKEREKFAAELKDYIEKFGKADEETAEKMKNLVWMLYFMKSPEKEVWDEKRKNLLRELVKKKLESPITDVENVISKIENLIECLSTDLPAEYQEIIDLRRKILSLLEENNFDEEKIISAKEELAVDLQDRPEGCEEALKLLEEVAEQNKNLYRPIAGSTIYALRNVARAFEDMENKSAALEKRKEILQILTDNNGSNQQILSAMKDIAYHCGSRRGIKNYNEALTWRKKILEFCREHFVSDGPEVIYALENLTDALKNLNLDSSEYREELAKIKSENLSEEHSDAISAKEDIADDLHERGKYSEEIELRLQIIDLYKKNFEMNGDFRNIADAMEKLAEVYDNVGRIKDSLDTWKKVVELYENEIAEGEENSSATIKILKKIHRILSRNIGDTAGDFKTLNRILAISEKIYSPGSRAIIRAKSDIARFYKSQGDDCKALQIRLEILNTRKENFQKSLSALGTDDAEVIRLIADLAEDFKKLHFEEEAAEKYDEHLNTCRRVADKLKKDFGEMNKQVTNLLDYLKKNLIRRDEYRESLKVCRRIIEIYKKKYNGNEAESDVIDSLDDEAEILSNLKKYPEGLNIRRKIFELYRSQCHGNISEDSIEVLQEVADCYKALEDFVGGLKIYAEELLPLISEKYDGDGTQDEFLRALKKKADIFKDTENFDEACKLREEIYNLFREKFGEESENTLETLEECAEAFAEAGLYEKALSFQQKLINTKFDELDVGRVLISLAEVLEKCGRKDDALRERGRIVAQTENLLNSTIEIYGENSEKTLEILNLLAKNLSDAERFKEEIQTRERIKNICKKIYGRTSQKYVTATEVVAKVYSDNDRTEEALNLRKEIADIRRELLNSFINLVGTNHKDTISAQKSLADVLEKIGESGEAKNLREENLNAFKEIADFRRKKFGIGHGITLQALKEYAQELEGTDKSEDALKIFREIVVALKEKFVEEEDVPEIIDALKNEADFLKHCNDYEEEEKIRREILNLCEKRFNFNLAYSETISALENLAECLQEIKKFDEAVRIRCEIINRLAKKYFGNNLHSEVITAKKKLASTFEVAGNYDAAVKEREKILDDLQKKFEGKQNGDNEISNAKDELHRVKNLRP